MIRAQGLVKSFGSVHAVRGVTFEAGPGEIVGFLGPNGAGKSTTMRMLTGYLPPTRGRASIAGFDTVADSIEARRRVGYLPENNALYPEMRVESYLRHRAALHGAPWRGRGAAVERALDRCWLRDVRRRRIGALSKGYRQRVGLAAAMLHDPPALILDEPTSGLDPAQIAETRRLLRELAHGRAILLSSHILPEVERTCDRVIVIARGRVRADSTPAALLDAMHASPPYIVETLPPPGVDPLPALRALPGVVAATLERAEASGWRRFRLDADERAPDLREPIARALREAGALTRELRREATSLETLFTRLIERAFEAEDEPAPSAPGETP